MTGKSDSFEDFACYQERVGAWVASTFGTRSLRDPQERARRLLEEAAELAQALGLPEAQARAVVKDVFAREPGQAGQEVGGLMNTLGALCAGLEIDLAAETEREMLRIEDPGIMAKCRRKNADKSARGVSDCGLTRNRIVFGDTVHEVSQAYAEGVQACRGGRIRFDAAPYGEADDRREEWLAGFSNAEGWDHVLEGWDHVLEDGSDALDLKPDGREIVAPEDLSFTAGR